MTYRDVRQTPSYGGVKFHNMVIRSMIGRRTVTIEQPLEDGARSKDLGELPDRFSCDGVLVGNFYHLDLEPLREVLKREGPHEFIHPMWGSFFCQLEGGPVTITETPAEGGTAKFTLNLAVVSLAQFPLIFDDPISALKSNYDLATANLLSDLELKIAYIPTGLSAVEADKHKKGLLQSLTDAVGRVGQALGKVNGKIAGKLNKINDLSNNFNDISAGLRDLLAAPGKFAAAFKGLVNSIVGIAKVFEKDTEGQAQPGLPPTAAGDAMLEVLNTPISTGHEEIDATASVSKDIESVMLKGIEDFVKGTVALETASEMTEVPMVSNDQSVDFSAQLAVKLDEAAENEDATDDTYFSVRATRVSMQEFADSVARDLPIVREFAVGIPTHAILIAHWVYRDADRDTDVLSQNDVHNPVFTGAESDGVLQVIDG